MKLAVVTGYVVCTVRHEGLARQTADGGDAQCPRRARRAMCGRHRQHRRGMRRVGTAGQRQLGATGARTRRSPVDLCVIGIVDEAAADGQVLFHK